MLYVFESWRLIAAQLRAASGIALFLDFDGTLARLCARPEDAVLDGPTRHALAALARSPGFRVWIVSGRREADLRLRAGVPGVRLLGLYGWEGRRLSASPPEETKRALSALSARLARAFERAPGIRIEDKRHAVAVHYRGATQRQTACARRLLAAALEPCRRLLRIEPGKCVLDIVPRERCDKGSAVTREWSALDPRPLPVYLGDDQADEAAFAALSSGITVRVGPGPPTRARYRLTGVAQVRQFLYRLKTEFA